MSKTTIDNHKEASKGSQKLNYCQFYILVVLFGLCVLFYYFGELVEFAGWKALHRGIFYSVHDLHRLLFMAPIVYAAYFFGTKAVIVVIILATAAFLPRALFISPFPDPLLRSIVFIVIAAVTGYLIAITRNQLVQLKREKATLLKIFDGLDEGILIIGPDYKIRYMNSLMTKEFGKGVGAYCYKYLKDSNTSCEQICKLPLVVKGETQKWQCVFRSGKTYDIFATAYTDSDGIMCQLTILHDIAHSKEA